MPSTESSRAISGKLFLVFLYCITDVHEITRSDLYFASMVISSSVIPSAKYPCDASPARLSRGSTAMERIIGDAEAAVAERETASR